MADMTALELAAICGLALVLSLIAHWLSGRFLARVTPSHAPQPGGAERHFLFRDGTLVDTDMPDFTLPDPCAPDEGDWARFRRWLAPRFDLPETAEDEITVSHGAAHVTLAPEGSNLRVTLADPAACAGARHDLLARLAGAERLDAALTAAPLPVWLRDADGRVSWQNRAARALPEAERVQLLAATDPGRVVLDTPTRCHDLLSAPCAGGTVLYATDVSATVQAAQAQRDFVHTLGKTFADLPTGLAVFDRGRTLAMFNPALTDLTGLDPVFLSSRPAILDFFDRLRDRQVMPEPRSYASWRGQIDAMIRAAGDGQYQEVWSLSNGRTYRVTGRPHPDGAVAFLLADISDEMASARDLRAARDLREAALDRIGEGVAVLDRDGTLIFCNRRFATLLRLPPETRAGLPLPDLLAACRARLPADRLWQSVEARLRNGAGEGLAERLPFGPDATLDLRLMPLGQARTMLALRRAPAQSGRSALSA